MTDPTGELHPIPSPEDSIRITLEEMGRGTIAAAPPEGDDSVLAPIKEPANARSDQANREIARNRFNVD